MTHFACDVMPEPNAISALTARTMDFLAGAGVDGRCAHHVAMMLDEMLTNVAGHGGNTAQPASIRVEVRPDRVSTEILDAGAAFDPRTVTAPDIGAAAEDRQVGGLGLMLVQRLACELGYERRGERNWTTFSVARRQPGV
jgi:serine/threonine-protein kinase RsbW